MRISFHTEGEAKRILANLIFILEKNGYVTLSNLNELLHFGYYDQDQKKGWTDLQDAKILWDDMIGLWYLILPKMKRLIF